MCGYSERVDLEFSTRKEILYLKATMYYFVNCVNTIGPFWPEKSTLTSVNLALWRAVDTLLLGSCRYNFTESCWLIPFARLFPHRHNKSAKQQIRLRLPIFFFRREPQATSHFRYPFFSCLSLPSLLEDFESHHTSVKPFLPFLNYYNIPRNSNFKSKFQGKLSFHK